MLCTSTGGEKTEHAVSRAVPLPNSLAGWDRLRWWQTDGRAAPVDGPLRLAVGDEIGRGLADGVGREW